MTVKTINKYLSEITAAEQQGGRTIYYIGDNFEIHVSKCDGNLDNTNSLMNIWKRSGFINQTLPSYIHINTYYTDLDGTCYGWYNITQKLYAKGSGKNKEQRMIIVFDYLREYTPENVAELVAECIKMKNRNIKIKKCK